MPVAASPPSRILLEDERPEEPVGRQLSKDRSNLGGADHERAIPIAVLARVVEKACPVVLERALVHRLHGGCTAEALEPGMMT
jgi:hypothetical protein